MKKFLTIFVLLTAIATPAFAQSFDPDEGTGNSLPFAYATTTDNGHAAYAQAPKSSARAERNVPTESPTDMHGNLGGSVVNGYVIDGY